MAKTKVKDGEARLVSSVAIIQSDGTVKSFLPGTAVSDLPDEFAEIEQNNPDAVGRGDPDDDSLVDSAEVDFDPSQVALTPSALDELDKPHLQVVADHHGIEYKSRTSKQDLIAALAVSDAASQSPEQPQQ